MATGTYVPVEVYLRTESEPDCEYVDGEIQERPMPEYDHSTWQGAILAFFRQHNQDWNTRARAELRVRVSPTRYRVPDVTVVDHSLPIEQIATVAPLAVFEILSPENTMTRMLEKLDDYEKMGIRGIWVIDPKKNTAHRHESGKLLPTVEFGVAGTNVRFSLDDLIALLD